MQGQLAEAHQIYVMAAEVRDELLAQLTDIDLAFRLKGNPALGELLSEYASVQRTYIDSFSTHLHDWGAVVTDAELAVSVERLRERFAQLDADLTTALGGLGDLDGPGPEIDRGGWQLSAGSQLHTLREALIITMGKGVVYLNALGKPIPRRVLDWVG